MNVKRHWSPSPARRWLQYRIRTLLAFMTLCAVVATFGGDAAAHRAEQRAMAELRALGGSLVVERPESLPFFG